MIPAAPSKTIKKQSRFPSANVLRGLLFSLFHSLLSHHDSQEGIISGISGCLAASCLINFRISVRRLWGHLGTSGDWRLHPNCGWTQLESKGKNSPVSTGSLGLCGKGSQGILLKHEHLDGKNMETFRNIMKHQHLEN